MGTAPKFTDMLKAQASKTLVLSLKHLARYDKQTSYDKFGGVFVFRASEEYQSLSELNWELAENEVVAIISDSGQITEIHKDAKRADIYEAVFYRTYCFSVANVLEQDQTTSQKVNSIVRHLIEEVNSDQPILDLLIEGRV